MTPAKARKIGIKYSLISAVYLFLLFQVIFLVSETKGDFSNGILFFLEQQLRLYTIGAYLLFFITFAILGQRAGQKIIVSRISSFKIACTYSILATIVMVLYFSFTLIQTLSSLTGIYFPPEKMELIRNFITFSMSMLLFFLAGWLLTTKRIRQQREK